VSRISASGNVLVNVRGRRVVDTGSSGRRRGDDASRLLTNHGWKRDDGLVGDLMQMPVSVGADELLLFLLKLKLKADGSEEGLKVVEQVLLGDSGVEIKQVQ
jgi:hypothetical protein